MKHYKFILSILLFSLVANISFAEHRFYPANSIYTTARMTSPRFIEGMIEEVEFRETTYYNIWTGNDTIVDGRECVTIWNNLEGIVGLEGVVYEDSTGLVYINRLQEENIGWEFLYDFTQRDWKVGDKIRTDFSGLEGWYEKVEEVSSITLHNGESVPCITTETSKLIYGIGYFDTPAFSRTEAYNGFSWRYDFVNFYRNGELLWGEEISQTNKPYLVTDGLQWAKCYYYYTGDYTTVAYELRGDTIIDGKSYKKEWSTCWENLLHMELTGYFMREDAGKVYRKIGKRDEYLWFDYEANIGDTIFYDYSFVKVIGHSDTTIVCNGVSRTYRGVDVQVGYVDSGTDNEYNLIPGYIETFYEELGLFTNGDIVRDPSFLETGGQIELLWLKRDGTMLYQQEESILWKDNTSVEGIKTNNYDTPYYDLQGRKVGVPTRGIYIKDGKKVVIKD